MLPTGSPADASTDDDGLTRSTLGRRTFVKALWAAGAAGSLGLTWRAFADPPATRFDLAAPTSPFFDVQQVVLHEQFRILQSFGFDNANRRLFMAQLQDDSDGNDLCINQVDFDGTLLGYMHVPEAGHGVSIGVEPVGDESYIWTEARSSSPAAEGRGTALQRFAFRSGERPSDAQIFLPGSDDITCATDAEAERLLIRRYVGDVAEYTLYDLDAARDGDFSQPLAPVMRPTIDGTFQGYTFAGDYLYVWTGGRRDDRQDPEPFDSALTSFDLRTGAVVQDHVPVRAGSDLPFREPEGMATYLGEDGRLRLCFGLASREEGLRVTSIFSKDELVR
jgi:hypothetical protein